MNTNSKNHTDDSPSAAENIADPGGQSRGEQADLPSTSAAPEVVEIQAGDGDTPSDEVSRLKASLADAEKRALLAAADLENFRKRNRQKTQEQLRYASLGIMSEILEAVDNLQRAIESAEKDANGNALLEGVKMVSDQLSSILESHGCQKIEAVGKPFDPNCHQAVQMFASDAYPANTVMQEMRTGFQLHDRVIRPAQVFVSTGPAN